MTFFERLLPAIGLAALVGCQHAPPAEPADAIWLNGPIITIDDAHPQAEAVAVRDGRIVAVGKRKAVLRYQGETTAMHDLQGRALLPGFVDAHVHLDKALLNARCCAETGSFQERDEHLGVLKTLLAKSSARLLSAKQCMLAEKNTCVGMKHPFFTSTLQH